MDSTHKSELSIVAALVATVAILAFSHFQTADQHEDVQRSIRNNLMLSELAGDIRYYNEVLTMSAQMAVYTNDPMGLWQERHSMTSNMLKDAMQGVTTGKTNSVVENIEAVNGRLVAVENLVFASLQAGSQGKAKALLNSDHYQTLKRDYNKLSYELHDRLNASILSNRAAVRMSQEEAKNSTFAIASLIALLWTLVLNRTSIWRREVATSTTHLTELAHYDNLTGLANRTLFNLRLAEATAQCDRTGVSLALIIVDVDKFKDVNDSYGHVAGDELLKAIARKLQNRARVTDTVARLGGDEFAIVATNVKDSMSIGRFAHSLIRKGSEKIRFENNTFGTSQSIGIALYPDDASDTQSLMQKADFALYQAKDSGLGQYRLFDQQLEEAVQSKRRMQEDIAASLIDDHFQLHYQPLIDINTGQLKGVEALIRWNHPERGFVPPDVFVPIAEECGLIIEVGDWVLNEACRQQVSWREQGVGDIVVAVNLSSVQFQNADLVSSIKRTVLSAGMSPGKLELEITESGIMDKGETVIELLQELNEFGLKLAIDDFGTGYSSLSYLKHFPVHHLKIDRDFVTELPHNKDDAAIARTIISMGHSMKLKVVAEGVETEDQLQFLRDEQCDYAQGYYISRPVAANDFVKWYQGRYKQESSSVVAFKAS
ncbi:MAG: putative bifunctional diguanylate cyclase/phosphodiesterase [Pseudomonadales bacterium]